MLDFTLTILAVLPMLDTHPPLVIGDVLQLDLLVVFMHNVPDEAVEEAGDKGLSLMTSSSTRMRSNVGVTSSWLVRSIACTMSRYWLFPVHARMGLHMRAWGSRGPSGPWVMVVVGTSAV